MESEESANESYKAAVSSVGDDDGKGAGEGTGSIGVPGEDRPLEGEEGKEEGGSSVSKDGAEEMDAAPDLTNNKRKAPPSESATGAGVSSPIAPPVLKRHEDGSLSSSGSS